MLTEEQRLNRLKGLGASDSSIIMGYSTFKTPYELYLEKTGIISIEDDEESEQQYWGNTLERVILGEFAKRNNVTLEFPDTIYHPKHPFMFANLDAYCPSLNAVVEAKNANAFMRQYWDDSHRDGMPMQYLIQVAKQVACADVEMGFCCVLLGGNEYKQFVYKRDLELERMIVAADTKFWDCVQLRIEPDLIAISDYKLRFPDSITKKIVAPESLLPTLEELADIRESIKKWEKRQDVLKMKVMEYMKDNESLVTETGSTICTWKTNKRGRTFLLK